MGKGDGLAQSFIRLVCEDLLRQGYVEKNPLLPVARRRAERPVSGRSFQARMVQVLRQPLATALHRNLITYFIPETVAVQAWVNA